MAGGWNRTRDVNKEAHQPELLNVAKPTVLLFLKIDDWSDLFYSS